MIKILLLEFGINSVKLLFNLILIALVNEAYFYLDPSIYGTYILPAVRVTKGPLRPQERKVGMVSYANKADVTLASYYINFIYLYI